MITIPALITDKLLGIVFDFLRMGGESLAKNITAKKAIKKAIERAAERFGSEYDDKELARTLTVDTKFYDLPSVQKAIRELLEHPFDPAPQIKIENEFSGVLSEKQRGFANQAAQAYFEILREELIGVEKLNDKLKLVYLKRTAVATERTARGIDELIAKQKILPSRLEEARRKYLKYIIDTNQYLDPRGIMQTRRSVALKLDDVYVSLTAEMETTREKALLGTSDKSDHTSDELKAKQQLSDIEKKSKVIIEKVDFPKAVRENRHLVILGDPGAGKTTVMRFLAIQFSHTCLSGDAQNVVDKENNDYGLWKMPLYVRISQYATLYSANKSASLRDFILGNHGEINVDKPSLSAVFEDALNNGAALVLLDGLDEIVNPNDRSEIGRRIEQFVSSCHIDNRFIVTSRIAGYGAAQLGGDFAGHTLILRDLDYSQIEKFLRRWCLSVENSLMPEMPESQLVIRANLEVDDILKSVSENIGVRRLAANPLMLTILALIHRNGTRLPSRRIELYQLAVKTLLEEWELARGLPAANIVRETEAIRLLAPLAYWMHEHKPNGLASEREVKERLAEVLANSRGYAFDHPEIQDAVDDFLRRVREHTGLFVERAPHQYGFMHLTFEEYFAAREMVKRRADAALNIYKYRHDPRWDEVISLAIAFESNDHPDDAQEYLQSAILAQGEIANKQGFVPSLYEDVLHRDLLFAVRILGDCVGLEASFNRTIIETLVIIWMDKSSKGKYEPLRERIMMAVRSLRGSDAAEGVIKPALDALKDKSIDVRVGAADILGRLDQTGDTVIKGLLVALNDNNEYVRAKSVWALGQLGLTTEAVLNGLLGLLQDHHPYVRSSAANALGALGEATPEIIGCLVAALQDKTIKVRQSAAFALGQLKRADHNVVSSLLEVLKDSDPRMRGSAASALGRLGQATDTIMSSLLIAFRDDNSDVHESAAYALFQLGQGGDILTTGLLDALKDERNYVRAGAASLLGKLTKGDHEIIDGLHIALEDKSLNVRGSAAYALVEIGQASDAAVNGLLELLKNEDADVRLGAVYALSQMGQVNDVLVDVILEALMDKQEYVRGTAASVLGQLGRSTNIVINKLLGVLSDEKKSVSLSAASALVQLGQVNEGLINSLIEALQDKHEFGRGSAAAALGELARSNAFNLKTDLRYSIHRHLFKALIRANDDQKVIAMGKYWTVSNHIWQALWDMTTPISVSFSVHIAR